MDKNLNHHRIRLIIWIEVKYHMPDTGKIFDVYIAIDFSGSQSLHSQKQHIAYAEMDSNVQKPIVDTGYSRLSVIEYLLERLKYYNEKQKRVLLGFDFSYSFPKGFWSTLTNTDETWEVMLRGMAEGLKDIPPIIEEPGSNARKWAETANEIIIRKLKTNYGPFWGPNFIQSKDPKFFVHQALPFSEYRLVEQNVTRCKPIFKIGGHGTVGLQSLCGIPLLHSLKSRCLTENISLHSWPFDGWDILEGNMLVEWYPAIYNTGKKSDIDDAKVCVEWARSMDNQGLLKPYFHPILSEKGKIQARFEGWILGVK